MESSFWHGRWAEGDIRFHQTNGHDMLPRHWPACDVTSGGNVLVPLAGKSRDMVWLADAGYSVTGVELSEIAIEDFFADVHLVPELQNSRAFTIYSAESYTLMRGNIFDLSRSVLPPIAGVYDRASLVALTEDQRARYAEILPGLIDEGTPMLVISLDYPRGEMNGPPFAVNEDEVNELFAQDFDIKILERRDGLKASPNLAERGLTRLEETAYLLTRRA